MGAARGLLTGALALCTFLGATTSANAVHHVMRISEVYPGEAADPDEEFIELQMFSAGQEFVGGHLHVRVYEADGDEAYEEEFLADVGNGDNQATILSGDPFFTPDLAFDANPAGYLAGAGGAACITSDSFGLLDCVSWGSFNDPTPATPGTPPSGMGTPEAAIPDAMSITRTQARGCATLLEGVDDSDDSDADFSATDATPRNNSAPITEVPCSSPPPGGGSTTPAPPGVTPKKKKKCKKPKKRSAASAKKKCKKKKK